MTYATQNNLIDRYGERLLIDLTDRDDIASGVIDEDAVNQALEDADAEINGYLSNRYQLPLEPVPPIIVTIACALTLNVLHTRELSPKAKSDYERAKQMLNDIASGKFRLPSAGIEPATTGASGVQVTDRERPFTPENLKGFI